MFGNNPIRKVDQKPDDGKLAVQEISYTIQGEGPFTGCPAVFIRLAGCHLACTFCDTEFETGINNRMAVQDIIEAAVIVTRHGPYGLGAYLGRILVVLTGGEPLRQTCGPLIRALNNVGFRHTQIETAGNLWDPSIEGYLVDGTCSLVCSPKTSHVHPRIQNYCQHWKYVVRAGGVNSSGLPNEPTQANGGGAPADVAEYGSTIWISPMDEHEPFKNAANVKAAVDICMKHGYRLSLQVHKILGMP